MDMSMPNRAVSLSSLGPERELCRIHCGDCIELLKELPPAFVKIVVTSPPYNLRNTTGGGLLRDGGAFSEGRKIRKGYNGHNDAMPHDEYVAWQRACLEEMMRVLRPDGAIFYNHKWRVQNGLLQDRADIVAGFPVRQIIIWQRNGGINFNPHYFLPTYEVIYLIAKADFRLATRANAVGDVWQFDQERNNPHPAPFPVELAQRCISSTDEGIVLDPFVGSGTTAIAAEMEEREWIGIDIDPLYCELAEKRIEGARRYQDQKLL